MRKATNSNTSLTWLLLPGMDGSGKLLTEFASLLAQHISIKPVVASYPDDLSSDYESYADYLISHQIVKASNLLVVAESFSGPIALELARKLPEQIYGIVFCASFAENPHRLTGLHRLPGLSPLIKRSALHRLPVADRFIRQ